MWRKGRQLFRFSMTEGSEECLSILADWQIFIAVAGIHCRVNTHHRVSSSQAERGSCGHSQGGTRPAVVDR
jgi:hypothetical protein